jgi:hypothetical protein
MDDNAREAILAEGLAPTIPSSSAQWTLSVNLVEKRKLPRLFALASFFGGAAGNRTRRRKRLDVRECRI